MWGDGWVRRGTQATIPTHPPPPPGNGQPWPALCAQSYGCQACKHMRIATHHDTAFHVMCQRKTHARCARGAGVSDVCGQHFPLALFILKCMRHDKHVPQG